MQAFAVVAVFEDGSEKVMSIFPNYDTAKYYAVGFFELSKHGALQGDVKRVEVRKVNLSLGDVIKVFRWEDV